VLAFSVSSSVCRNLVCRHSFVLFPIAYLQNFNFGNSGSVLEDVYSFFLSVCIFITSFIQGYPVHYACSSWVMCFLGSKCKFLCHNVAVYLKITLKLSTGINLDTVDNYKLAVSASCHGIVFSTWIIHL
jgi:hypothetical protein